MDDVQGDDPFSQDEQVDDPFSPHNLAISQFIMSCRTYDVLMALLTEANPTLAKDLLELHATGSVMGPQPAFNGQFITDLVNQSEDSVNEGETTGES